MLLLLDEYGDKGLKLDGGSSRWLIIVGSLFGSREQAEECGERLRELHGKLGGREFHFAKDSSQRKAQVLELIAGFPFTYHCVACDKFKLRIRDWKPDDLYDEVAGQLIDALKPALEKCTVWFDTQGGRGVDREYGQRLTRRAGHFDGGPRIAHTKRMDSDKQVLGQLADYVCGAVSRSIRAEAENADEFRQVIKAREGQVISWPVENETG
jgi:hypothetical protein